MKITIERKSFIDALSIGSQMAGKSKGLVILDNCKITCKNDTATISSYDSEVAITKRTNIISHDSDIVFCIEPKSLLAILRSLKDENVTLELEEGICKIIHSKGNQEMPYESAEDFPTPVFDDNTKTFEIDSDILYSWLKSGKQFVGTNTLYPSMMGVFLYLLDNECGVASTDTCVLYHDKINADWNGGECGASVCVKAIDALLPMILETNSVQVLFGERNVAFRTNDAMLVAIKTTQPYPNFKAIIPNNNEISVVIDKEEFLETIKRAMLTTELNSLLRFQIQESSLIVESEDFMYSKKTKEECNCSCVGGNINICLKGTYVLSMLNCIESDEVVMELSGPERPILWKDSSCNEKVLMQMPYQAL